MLALPDKIYCCSIPLSTGKEQAITAHHMGRSDRDIFVEGRGAETFAACVAAIRGPGTLGLVGGLRVFGDSRPAMMAKVRILRERRIHPYDLKTGVSDPVDLLDAAIASLNAHSRMGPDKRRPKRLGRHGGEMKGKRAKEHRDSIMNEDVVRRLCEHPALSWEDCSDILGGPPFSASTLRRQFGGFQT